MIIVRAPLRVSFFGGGTDHPLWFRGIGAGRGAVLSTSINKYIYVTLRRLPPIFNFRYRVAWSQVEQVAELEDIKHPVVREALRHYATDAESGYEVSFNSDLPARSGLGSSSACSVATLHAISRHFGQTWDKYKLASEAIRLEQDILAEPVGCQDQVGVCFGGLNRIDFNPNGSFDVEPIDISPRRAELFEKHLMLFFTGFTRDAGNIEKSKFSEVASKQASLNKLYDLVLEAQTILEDPRKDLKGFGALLHEAWVAKRSLSSSVSNSSIDLAYETGIANGACGGKLLGAGGGGLLFFVPPEKQQSVREAMRRNNALIGNDLVEVPIRLENEGSRVILHQPDFDSAPVYTNCAVRVAVG
jgi:D-glycero-alpha-D-manno-heptose-7-phosphate kinase